jgi:predicted amidophosphoribosyltransferase
MTDMIKCDNCGRISEPYFYREDDPICEHCSEPVDVDVDRVWMCEVCDAAEATCDDWCPKCAADYYVRNPAELDAGDSLWKQPGWRDALVLLQDRLRPPAVSDEVKGAVYALMTRGI